jgi:hypothetical protein
MMANPEAHSMHKILPLTYVACALRKIFLNRSKITNAPLFPDASLPSSGWSFFAEHQRNFSQESDSGKMELRIARDMPRITLNESRLRRIPLKTLLI